MEWSYWMHEGDDGMGTPNRDPDYDIIPPLPKPVKQKKGSQCGECGMKFDYNTAYGYCCQRDNCPTQFRAR